MLKEILSLLDFFKTKIPIQDRTERWKNEIDKLEQRQSFIEVNKRNDLAREYERNAKRLQDLYKLCKNKASD